jgi:uncharacterized protein YnzC (UPF0291/DUF896 family)
MAKSFSFTAQQYFDIDPIATFVKIKKQHRLTEEEAKQQKKARKTKKFIRYEK